MGLKCLQFRPMAVAARDVERGIALASTERKTGAEDDHKAKIVSERGGNGRIRISGRCAGATQSANSRGRDRRGRYRRRGDGSKRTRSRRVGHCRNDGSTYPVCQDGGDRQSGALRPSRPSQGQIQGLGTRLWARRLAEAGQRAGKAAQPARGRSAERDRRSPILSGHLLVFDAEDSGCEPVRR
jgi:hypothetical protein